MIVPIEQVIPTADSPSKWSIRKMMEVLKRQGQIEPLQVAEVNGKYLSFAQDAYGNDIVYAARALGWSTILIAVMARYEQ